MWEKRKEKEAIFHNKIRNEKLKENRLEYKRLTSNKKFYSITRRSRNFINNWLLARCRGKKILDYGCGNGEISIFLAKNGAKVIGIDISNISIENAKKKAIEEGVEKNTSFFVMDAEKLEFKENSFDIIVCSGVLHHLDIQRAYSELARTLKPDGEIICNEPLIHNPIFQLYRKITPHLRTKWEIEHILSKSEIKLAGNYFEKIEIKFFHLTTLLAVPFRNSFIFNFLLTLLEWIDSLLLRLPLIRWLSWQVVFILAKPKFKDHS